MKNIQPYDLLGKCYYFAEETAPVLIEGQEVK